MSDATAPVPALPDGIRLENVGGAPALVVETPASTAVVHLDGAHVTSWVPAGGREVLWMSPDATIGEGEAIRGGIPLIGPWFGPGRDGATTPKHGWLRTHRWSVTAAERLGDAAAVVLELTGADPSGQGIAARCFVGVGEHLTVELTVTAGVAPLELESALHSYLAIGDVRRVRLEGFAGADYLDNLDGLARRHQEGELALTGPTDRVYEIDGEVAVADPVLGRTVREEPAGSSRTVVWNPWDEGAAGIGDMPDDAWTGFVCVETAVAKDGYVWLAPGEEHALRVRLVVEEGVGEEAA